MDFVGQLLVNEKFDTFLVYFRYPIPTNALMDEVFKQMSKVFEGRNPVYNYVFRSANEAEDWSWYRNNILNLNKWWRVEGTKSMATRHNSIVVADLPSEQTSDRPEPYLFFVPVENVLQLATTDYINTEWVAFTVEEKTYVYDDEFYRVFQSNERNEVGEMISESRHDLGYCPCRMFWEDSVNDEEKLIKLHLAYPWLTKIENALYFDISNEDLNTIARFPVASTYDVMCDFVDENTKLSCKKGWLYNGAILHFKDRKPVGCPECSKKRFNGPGSLITVSPPSPGNDNADQSNPFKYADTPIESLEYNNADVAARYMKIYSALTGFKGSPISDKAVNKEQVAAIMESLEGALVLPQRNIESIMEWAESTLCRLRYNTFESASISLGTDHFVMSSTDILEVYGMAKEKGASANVLDQLQDRYFDSEYRNNPEMKQRQQVFNLLDPFRHLTIMEVKDMYSSGQIPFELFMLKINMSTLVSRFESELFPITSFDKNTSLADRVSVIREQVMQYISELKPEPVEETEEGDKSTV